MDFGDYDVLDDILSDGSNDSFFDEPKPTSKTTTTNRPKTDETQKEPKQDDWLGTQSSTKNIASSSKGKIDWLGLDKKDTIETDTKESLTRSKKTTKKISFEDDDILGTLGFSDKTEKPKRGESPLLQETRDKKTDMLESILKSNIKEKSSDNVPKIGNITAKTSSEGYVASSNANNQEVLGFAREGRRKRVTSGLVDPLGLFSDQPNEEPLRQMKASDGKNRTRSFSSGDTKDIDAMSSTKSQYGDTRSVPNLLETQGELKSIIPVPIFSKTF